MEFESVAVDFDTRVVWPVNVSYIGANWTSSINAHRTWNVSSGRRAARFNALVRLQQLNTITFPGQPPADMKFQLVRTTDTGSSSVWTILNVPYPSMAGAMSVTVSGTVVNPIAASVDSSIFLKNSTCGASKFFSSNNTLSLVVTGANSCQVRVTLSSTVEMTTRISTDIPTFNFNGGVASFVRILALALNISASRIVVRDLYEGSAVVVYQITPDPTLLADPTAVVNNFNQLSGLIQQGIDLGSLGPIISSSGVVSMVNSDGTQTATSTPTNDLSPATGLSQTVIIVVAVVCSLVGAAIISVGLYFLIKKLRMPKVSLNSEEVTCQSPMAEAANPKRSSTIKVEVVHDLGIDPTSEAAAIAENISVKPI